MTLPEAAQAEGRVVTARDGRACPLATPIDPGAATPLPSSSRGKTLASSLFRLPLGCRLASRLVGRENKSRQVFDLAAFLVAGIGFEPMTFRL